MKKLGIIGIILIILLPILTSADKVRGDLDIVYDLLKKTGAEFHESDTVTNGVILKKFLEEDEMKELGEEIFNNFQIKGEESHPFVEDRGALGEVYYKQLIFEDKYSQINYSGYDKNQNLISIYLSSYLYEEEIKGETYLSINIIKNDDFFRINDIMDKVESIYHKYDSIMDSTTCLIGTIKGQQPREELSKKIKKIIKDLKGNIIGEYTDDMILSFTAYTPLLKNSLTMKKEKINLNLATRYNEHEDTSYIWIGTPIITIGY